jgi:hypothetical protein
VCHRAVPAAAGPAAAHGGVRRCRDDSGRRRCQGRRARARDPDRGSPAPLRAFNSLRREGIHTVGDLAARNEADLLAIANLGPQSVSEIKQKLAERG